MTDFTVIPLSFATMKGGYVYRDKMGASVAGKEIDAFIKKTNEQERKDNAKKNEARAEQGLEPLELKLSTSCCMQLSASFNVTSHKIPKAGTRIDRDNLKLGSGNNYILTVEEFRGHLMNQYGASANIETLKDIELKAGIITFGNWHIELWDGTEILQKSHGMAANILDGASMFWQIGEPVAKKIPDWLHGWWGVTDGNQYYYYFDYSGFVVYIKTKPNVKWKPPITVGNRGRIERITDYNYKIYWNAFDGAEGTKEDFTRLNWTSETEMNGTSNKYSPLYAWKLG